MSYSENPATGERLRWHVGSAESGGRLARLEMWCAPGGGVPHRHIHPHSEERFEVLAGELEVVLGERTLRARAGEHVVLPAGVPHRWTVVSAEEAHFFVEIDDPRGFEEQVETMFALGRLGKLRSDGRVQLLYAACLSLPYMDSAHLAFPPVPVQHVLFRALVGIARLTGHARTVADARRIAHIQLAGQTTSRRRPVSTS